MGQLDGRVAIVTGAAQGIGAAYARRLAAHGAKVVVSDLLDPGPMVAEIEAAGGEALGITADVTDDGQIDAMVRGAMERWGRIDALVNNAALFGHLKQSKFEDIDADEWDAVMRVNIRGIWQVTKAVAPEMRRRKYGKIVNIASGTVFKGVPMLLHYVSSKGAIVAMTRALARELGDDCIRVNALAPGLTLSDAVAAQAETFAPYNAASLRGRAIKRDQMPDDLIGAALFLASDDSAFMTGQTLVVDGGDVVN